MTRLVSQEHAATVNDKGNARDNAGQNQKIDGRNDCHIDQCRHE
jgi:hypothetical protein